MAKRKRKPRKCLIVERHVWETGAKQQQLQLVLDTARRFFGSGAVRKPIKVRVFMPAVAKSPAIVKDISISQEYRNGTRRTNEFPEMGAIISSFIFFEETEESGVYDVWWETDKAIVAAKYQGWQQGKNTQYGRGRLSIIVDAPVPRVIDRVD